MRKTAILTAILSTALPLSPASAQAPQATESAAVKPLSTTLGLVVFPAKGQSKEKQGTDETECYAWSKQQTGVDPFAAPTPAAAPAQAAAPAESKAGGERLRGAARGAAAGAVIGEVANDDAGEGAAIGATAGVVAGGRQKRKAEKEAQQQAATQQQAASAQAQQATSEQHEMFNKGFSACLESRGYTVK